MYEVETDCRSEEGITIGLIDSIIFISRVLVRRDLDSEAIQSVLSDLKNDEDLGKLLK